MDQQPQQIFILRARGYLVDLPNGCGRPISRHAFLTREAAEAYVPEFKVACITRKSDLDFGLCYEEGLEIKIIELQIYE